MHPSRTLAQPGRRQRRTWAHRLVDSHRSGQARLIGALALAFGSLPAWAANPIAGIDKLWAFTHTDSRGSEIIAFDGGAQGLFVAGGNGLDVLNLAGSRIATLATTAFGAVNSIAIHGGIAAVSFSNSTVQNPGSVQFFDTAAFVASGGAGGHLGGVTVGAVPDMVVWTPDGSRLLVANEGERQSNAVNPAGSVSLIQYNAAAPATSAVQTLGFTAWDGQEAALRAAGVRIQAGVAASIALEPEYIAIAPGGLKAAVTLQENNALAFIDLALPTPAVTAITPLGLKDYNAPGQRIDPSDQDGGFSLRNVPVKGLYMPDSVAAYSALGKTYYVMANEGDAFVDDSDVVRFGNNAVTLDPGVFNGVDLPTQAQLKPNSALGRLNVVRTGATGDGSTTGMAEIISLGGRSFSIRDEQGQLVFDSGEQLEALAAAAGLYADSRSDDKGVEPEGVALFTVAGRTLAAIGLERTTRSAVALYDVTDPANASFLQFIDGGLTSEIRAEGLTAFEAGGFIYLAVANEGVPDDGIAGVTALYRVTPVPEPGSAALLLAGLGALAWRARRRAGVQPAGWR